MTAVDDVVNLNCKQGTQTVGVIQWAYKLMPLKPRRLAFVTPS